MCAALAMCSRLAAASANDTGMPLEAGTAAADAVAEVWLAVRINQVTAAAPARVARREDGHVLATAVDLALWRINPPTVAPLSIQGRQYLPLDAIAGLTYRIDEPTQELVLDGQPEAFGVTRIGPRRSAYRQPDVGPAGVFLNYDLQVSSMGEMRTLDGQLEVAMFNSWGFGSSTALGQASAGQRRLIRLDSTWTRDQPSDLRSLVIGDNASRGGTWGNSVRFAGLQWATNFAVRPDFVPFALPTIRGVAALPSTIDLYVDNALRMTSKVPSGPFEITRAPVVSGDGQVRLVVRDPLGRETMLSQPYYVSAALLPPGVRDEAYEVGFVRRRYAIASNDYGPMFGAATVRLGVDERTTTEWRGEVMPRQQTIGAAVSHLAAFRAQVTASMALSRSPEGVGSQLGLGIDRQAKPVSFGLQARLATPRFTALGGAPELAMPRRSFVANANYAAGRAGSIFASIVDQTGQAGDKLTFLTAGYNVGLVDRLYLSAFALRSLSGKHNTSVGINLTWALGQRTSSAVSHSRDSSGSNSSVQVQQSLPQGTGVGYRLATSTGASSHDEAALLVQNGIGTYALAIDRLRGSTSYRAAASGGAALLDGRGYLSRRIDESFAIVKVGDYANVDIYLENQTVAHTDATGHALVPGLRAYQRNVITVPPDKLPLDAEFTDLRLELTPARRSAVRAVFPARPSRGALLKIVLDDGAPLPSGALVRVAGSRDEFPVARRGEAYVKGLAQRNVVRASWKQQACDIVVDLPPDSGPVPIIGPLLCTAVRP